MSQKRFNLKTLKDDESDFESDEIMEEIQACKIGDHVICRYTGGLYFKAVVSEIDLQNLTYTVNWDDGDSNNRFPDQRLIIKT